MAKTTPMKLVELMVYREDIHKVLTYLGTLGEFQFKQEFELSSDSENPFTKVFNDLTQARITLGLPDLTDYQHSAKYPDQTDQESASHIIEKVSELRQKELKIKEELEHIENTYKESLAFSNLKVSYGELESLSYLTMRIGKINPDNFDILKEKLGMRAVLIPLGNDKSNIIAACSKNGRFFMDTELKNCDFVEVKLPKDFKGIPDDVLENLLVEKNKKQAELDEILTEIRNFAQTHKEILYEDLERFSVGAQIYAVEKSLESTEYVYRIQGWIPAYEVKEVARNLDELTEKRTGFRDYLPSEVASVESGVEKVPVRLKHGKVVGNFERMIFSYGAPLYGTVDPTPFVAIFFTILFGIMFGDAGQGFVLLLAGLLMSLKKFKLMGWEKFGPIFICIGLSSMIMGVLNGEVFANETLLIPFSRWVTGLFGTPRDQIIHLMPDGSKGSIMNMFIFFGVTIGVGFVINSVGLIINIINNFILKKPAKALFGKNGLSGAFFFWYVIFFALRLAVFKGGPKIYDLIIIVVSLILTAFCEPIERAMKKEKPVFENGFLSGIISALVEIIEVISGYISNTVSFLRVGAFALSHAVLSFIIAMMVEKFPGAAGIVISVIGNAIIIVLEGMIVAIQVVRLQYYEFFSKFFNETGREFKPFAFHYKVCEEK